MQPEEYSRLREYESWYWWYLAQRADLVDAVRRLRPARGAKLLDAGCGSGRNLIELRRALSIEAHGVDVSPRAAALWNGTAGVHRCVGSVNELPFPDGFFDIVTSVDVIGCEGVRTEEAVQEMARTTKNGGSVVILAPAYSWMRSRHDAAVHSVRRFTRGSMRVLAASAGLAVERLTYRFALFFPAIAVSRLIRKVGAGSGISPRVRSDLSPLPGWLNRMLYRAAQAEQKLLGNVDLPFGSTILLVARKTCA